MSQKFDSQSKTAPVSPGVDPGPDNEPCRTSPLVAGFSICLKKMRFCPYALSFGHQYLCRHPEHASFAVNAPQKPRTQE